MWREKWYVNLRFTFDNIHGDWKLTNLGSYLVASFNELQFVFRL